MSPIVLSALRDGLLSVLALVTTALATVLGTAALAWLKAHTTQTQYAAATAIVAQVVTGIEQEMGNSPGASKKDAALRATAQMAPWLPPSVASTLIESSVGALNGISATPPTVHVVDATPQAAAHIPPALAPAIPPAPAQSVAGG